MSPTMTTHHLYVARTQDCTPWAIKTCHFIFDHNSHVSWWIFALFVPKRNEYATIYLVVLNRLMTSSVDDVIAASHRTP